MYRQQEQAKKSNKVKPFTLIVCICTLCLTILVLAGCSGSSSSSAQKDSSSGSSASSSAQQNTPSEVSSPFVGTWELTSVSSGGTTTSYDSADTTGTLYEAFVFNDDGSGTIISYWTYSDNNGKSNQASQQPFTYVIDGDKSNLTYTSDACNGLCNVDTSKPLTATRTTDTTMTVTTSSSSSTMNLTHVTDDTAATHQAAWANRAV